MKTPRAAVTLAIACAVLVGAGTAGAQTGVPQVTLSARGGVLLPDGDTRPELDDGALGAGSVGILVHPRLGFEGTYGAAATKQTGGPDTRVNHTGLDAIFHVLPASRIDPYLAGGWAQLEYDPDSGQTQTLNGWEAGAGVDIWVVPRVAVRVDARDVMVQQDSPHQEWLHNALVTGGVQFAFGGRVRDTDGDGVGDKQDRCLDTPVGATVDATGCPSDADGDGVYDGIDTCAETPHGARVDARGCPIDSDGDGVWDGLDACPDTPRGALVDSRGCPIDGDGDGVPDGIDQCADTPTGALVDATGCPSDADGDGVYDGIDKCPDTAAGLRVDKDGCPIAVSEKEIQLLDTGLIRLENVQFDSGKAKLKRSSYPALDEVGNILAQWPELQIEIGGHTDATGATKFNQQLSQQRALAVLMYLEQKFPGLNPSQYSAVGYGKSQPVADNKTAAGRAQNRRVEFKVLNRDTLRKEIERRQLLRKDGQ